MTGAVVKPATGEGELTEIRRLFREYAQGLNIDLRFQHFDRELTTLPSPYIPPHGMLLLAWVDQRPAGCIALRPIGPSTGEIKRLYVVPRERGQGVATTLMLAVIEHAHSAGLRTLRLDTVPGMDAATSLYRKLGFREIPAYYFNPIAGTIYLELRLDASRSLRGHAD